ncbi:hypothetical protein [Escherichia phage vB_EcoM_ULIM9]|nr:hypothetical protein [Escherichia phage vB_EcoM_ULIM9]
MTVISGKKVLKRVLTMCLIPFNMFYIETKRELF